VVTWVPMIPLESLKKAKVVAMENETVQTKAIRTSARTIDEWVLGIGFLRNRCTVFSVPKLVYVMLIML
jgi:hypothetical protein